MIFYRSKYRFIELVNSMKNVKLEMFSNSTEDYVRAKGEVVEYRFRSNFKECKEVLEMLKGRR